MSPNLCHTWCTRSISRFDNLILELLQLTDMRPVYPTALLYCKPLNVCLQDEMNHVRFLRSVIPALNGTAVDCPQVDVGESATLL